MALNPIELSTGMGKSMVVTLVPLALRGLPDAERRHAVAGMVGPLATLLLSFGVGSLVRTAAAEAVAFLVSPSDFLLWFFFTFNGIREGFTSSELLRVAFFNPIAALAASAAATGDLFVFDLVAFLAAAAAASVGDPLVPQNVLGRTG